MLKYIDIKISKILIIAFTFFLSMIERYSFEFHRLKLYHIFFVFIILITLPYFLKIKIRKIEGFTLSLVLFSLSLSLINSINFYKSLSWTTHIIIIFLGLLSVGILLRPKLNEIFFGITIGSIPSVIYAFYEYTQMKMNHLTSWNNIIRLYSTAYEPGNLALMLFFPSTPFLIWTLQLGQKTGLKFHFPKLILFISLLSFVILILSTGRSGWICIPFFLVLYTLFYPTLRRILLLSSTVLLSIVFFLNNKTFYFLISDYFNRKIQYDVRYQGFEKGIEVFYLNPLFGTGIGGFGQAIKSNFARFWQETIQTSQIENYKELVWNLTTYNLIVEQLVNFGIIGLIWLVFTLICLYSRCISDRSYLVVFIITVSSLCALLFNQNIFRPYLMFFPILFLGSQIMPTSEKNLNN